MESAVAGGNPFRCNSQWMQNRDVNYQKYKYFKAAGMQDEAQRFYGYYVYWRNLLLADNCPY